MRCIICGSLDAPANLYAGLVKCNQCGLIYALEQPCDEEITSLYDSSYFNGAEYKDYQRDKLVLQRNFRRRIEILSRHSSGGSLLEIGSAHGFFLELAKERWATKGLDISEHACLYARKVLGLDVIASDFLNLDLAEPIDVFCMWDTIEHLKTPHEYLAKMAQLSHNDTLLCITTGDIGSILAKVQRAHWRLVHPPTHLFYFSKKTLAQLLEKYGFRIEHLSRVGSYRSLDQIAYSLLALQGGNRLLSRIYRCLKASHLLDGSCYLNFFDILFVVARYVPPEARESLGSTCGTPST